jgi:hypothetical protein
MKLYDNKQVIFKAQNFDLISISYSTIWYDNFFFTQVQYHSYSGWNH